MKTFQDFKTVYEIPIEKSVYNQTFSCQVSDYTFEFEIRIINNKLLLSIKLGDKILLDSTPIKTNFPLNLLTMNLFDKGYFFARSSKNNEASVSTYDDVRLYYGSF